MSYTSDYTVPEPTRAEIDSLDGLTLLEFGSEGCPFCIAAQPYIKDALQRGDVRHIKVEDGSGKPLGRSFGIKLWPTLILLRNGEELARAVRPSRSEVRELMSHRPSEAETSSADSRGDASTESV